MAIVKVAGFAVSLDGFGAGPNQDLKNPLGVGGTELHQWVYKTKMFKTMFGGKGGETGIDNTFAEKAHQDNGAWILGRNMFGPVRGPWADESWKGWWGDNPPYHTDVFVLTHHPRSTLKMQGGTVFHFITDGLKSALRQAKDAAKGKNVRIGGGVSVVRQYLEAGVIDEMHLVYSPAVLGSGEHLFSGLNLKKFGFSCVEYTMGERAMHVLLRKPRFAHTQ